MLTKQEQQIVLVVCVVCVSGIVLHVVERHVPLKHFLSLADDERWVRRVSLNHACYEELLSVPRIGPGLAQRIMAYRPYKRLEDLRKVEGISPGTFHRIKKYFRL